MSFRVVRREILVAVPPTTSTTVDAYASNQRLGCCPQQSAKVAPSPHTRGQTSWNTFWDQGSYQVISLICVCDALSHAREKDDVECLSRQGLQGLGKSGVQSRTGLGTSLRRQLHCVFFGQVSRTLFSPRGGLLGLVWLYYDWNLSSDAAITPSPLTKSCVWKRSSSESLASATRDQILLCVLCPNLVHWQMIRSFGMRPLAAHGTLSI